jgi:hypothetical protein
LGCGGNGNASTIYGDDNVSNAIASLSMQLGLDTREFTDGVVATQRELKLLKKIIQDAGGPQEELTAQLAGIQRLRDKFTTVPEEKWQAAIKKVYDRYHELTAVQAEVVDERQRVGGADIASFAGQRLTSRFGIVDDLASAATAAGPYGVAIAGALAGIGVAGAAAAKGVELLATTTLEGIDRLNRLNDEATLLGVSASSLQRLETAARLGGASVESVTTAMRKMSMVLGDPSAETVATLEAMGLQVSKLKNMRADQAFAAIGSEIDKLPTKAEQLAAISDIFGKGNVEIANLLGNFDEFMAQADTFTLSDEQFAAIGNADDALDQLGLNLTKVADITAVTLAPAVEDVSNKLTAFLSQDATQTQLLTGLLLIQHTIEVLPDFIDAAAESLDQMAKGGMFGDMISSLAMINDLLPESVDKTAGLFDSLAMEAEAIQQGAELSKKLAESNAKIAADMAQQEQDAIDNANAVADMLANATELAMLDAGMIAAAENEAAAIALGEAERAQEFQTKLQSMLDDAVLSMTDEGKMRLEAMRAGAANEPEIQAYIDLAKELERVKKSEQDLAEVQKARQQTAIENAREYERMIAKLETPEERAARELKRFAELGATQVEIDAMANQMADALIKKPGQSVALSGIVKGSKEDVAQEFARQREDRQQKTLVEIRDALRQQLKKDVVLVEEVSIL